MKKHASTFVLAVALAAMLAACWPAGDPLVTITGSINVCKAKEVYVLDQAAFARLSVERTYNDPWDGKALYKGILLSKVLELVKASDEATTITLTSKDSLVVTIQIADILQHDIMFARWKDGVLLTEETHGPVKIEFPDGLADSYTPEDWAWWVLKAEIK